MDWKEFVDRSNAVDIWESNTEEHNRYIKPPRGANIFHWVHMLFKLKYEFFKHRPNKEEEE